MTVWEPAYIGIGSNLDEPRSQVLRAIEHIGTLRDVRLVLRSRLYGSRPLGDPGQPDFVNAVVGVLVRIEPLALLGELRAIERDFGRPQARERWGPRVIDLDLLVYGRERSADPRLLLPHPGVVDRNFVLYPLADIAPDLDVPGLGRVADLERRVPSEGIWALEGGAASADAGDTRKPAGRKLDLDPNS